MATYKVLQDVEAEDKLIGPLTLRQFIYAGISAICLYLTYFSYSKGVSFMAAVFMPAALTAAFFAFPWGRDQPTELWALAKIRFMLKPRRRIWDQSGIKEFVTITAPKKLSMDYSNGLSETEVKSRLRALADTLDSRGWIIKNSNLNLSRPGLDATVSASDRLVGPTTQAQPVSAIDIRAADDIMDERNNPIAQQFGNLIEASTKARRRKIMTSLQAPDQPAQPSGDYWFLNQPAQAASVPQDMVTFNTQVVGPGLDDSQAGLAADASSVNESGLLQELKNKKQEAPNANYYGHQHNIEPLSTGLAKSKPEVQTKRGSRPTTNDQAVKSELAGNNELNVNAIARRASRSEPDDSEVVINLHQGGAV